jgi:hypothetical protein
MQDVGKKTTNSKVTKAQHLKNMNDYISVFGLMSPFVTTFAG